jgi:iron complex outermembrane receptor protein
LALLAGAPALAQPAASDDANALEELVVTALKRSTVLQQTPIAITAVSETSLARMGANDVSDYFRAVPSLTLVDSGPGSRRVVIRGVQSAGEPTVGFYYDEMPLTGSVGTGNDAGGRTPELRLFDVTRVEVLRGPQGTLYGSGSMGGTVRVLFNKPSMDYEGAVRSEIATTKGGEASYEVNGMVNVPLVEDRLALRLVGFYADRGGYVDNVRRGEKNINDVENYGGRAMLRITPTENLTIDASANIQRIDTAFPQWNTALGRYNSSTSINTRIKDDSDYYNVTAKLDFAGMTLTAVSSYLDRSYLSIIDSSDYYPTFNTAANCARIVGGGAACTPAQAGQFTGYINSLSPSGNVNPQETTNWTNELRLSSDGSGPLTWTVGVFSEERKSDVRGFNALADGGTGELYAPLRIFSSRFIKDELKQTAAFGEASYEVTPSLTLTGGARYFKYDKTVVGRVDIPLDLLNNRATDWIGADFSEDGWVFKFNADYKITPDAMVYATASQGFRPGGANQVVGLPDLLTPYESDSLWNYEAGVKTMWFERRLSLNLSAFQIDWKDMQVTGRAGTYRLIANAGAARIRGLEAEISARPMSGLSISANGTFTDAKLTEDQINPNVTAAGRDGDRIPYVPEFAGSISADFDWSLTASLDAMVHVDVSHVGSSFTEFRPTEPLRRENPAYTLVNARTGVSNGDGWELQLFVNNVFNDKAISAISINNIQGLQTLAVSSPPRTVGLQLNKTF